MILRRSYALLAGGRISQVVSSSLYYVHSKEVMTQTSDILGQGSDYTAALEIFKIGFNVVQNAKSISKI